MSGEIDGDSTAAPYRYRKDLRSMSDEVLFEELHDTWLHLRAAGLEADADLVNELAGRWLKRRDAR